MEMARMLLDRIYAELQAESKSTCNVQWLLPEAAWQLQNAIVAAGYGDEANAMKWTRLFVSTSGDPEGLIPPIAQHAQLAVRNMLQLLKLENIPT